MNNGLSKKARQERREVKGELLMIGGIFIVGVIITITTLVLIIKGIIE